MTSLYQITSLNHSLLVLSTLSCLLVNYPLEEYDVDHFSSVE